MKRLQIISMALLSAIPFAGFGLINSSPTQAYPIEKLTLSEENPVSRMNTEDPPRHRHGRYRYGRFDYGRYDYGRHGRYDYGRYGRYGRYDHGRYGRYDHGRYGRYDYGRYGRYGRFVRYVIYGGYPTSTNEMPVPMVETK